MNIDPSYKLGTMTINLPNEMIDASASGDAVAYGPTLAQRNAGIDLDTLSRALEAMPDAPHHKLFGEVNVWRKAADYIGQDIVDSRGRCLIW